MGVPTDPDPPVSDITQMISPTPGSTLTQDTTFTWSGKEGRRYDLMVGSTPGGNDYHDRDANFGSKSEEVIGLPVTGEKVYVRLTWSDDVWATFDEENYEFILPTPDPDALTITSFDVPNNTVTENSVKIHWSTTGKTQGSIEYGTTMSYGQQNPPETSFLYDTHIQIIKNLTPDTKYYYKITATNEAGKIAAKAGSFTTAKESDGGGTATNGSFYGNYWYGTSTGNGRLAYESSRRFRAEKTGYITHTSHENRVVTNDNIYGRCERLGTKMWCDCVENNLDRYTCGYTISNSYSVGNGGNIHVELHEDDGSSLGIPSGISLGKTNSYIPMEEKALWPRLKFDNPVKVEEGKWYHLVYKNKSFPTSCSLSGVKLDQAGSCPRNQGAISLNGDSTYWPEGHSFDPYRGSASANFHKSGKTSSWSKSTFVTSYYEVGYDDGTWLGDTYGSYNARVEGKGLQNIGGSKVGRQNFLVEGEDRKLDGVWISFGHNKGINPSGAPLLYKLKGSNGAILASGSIDYSSHCFNATNNYDASRDHWTKRSCREWKYDSFGKTVTVKKGSRYYLEISSAKNDAYVLHAFYPLDFSPYNSTNANHWNNAQAQYSTNSGSTWNGWAGSYYPNRDLPLLFTIEGQPRENTP